MAESNGDIDGRLEALTMNLELMSHSVEAHDRQMATIVAAIEARDHAHDRQMATIMDALQKLVNVTNEDATAIRTLARLAEVHEKRIGNLEGGQLA